jgi:glycosyltransferase involved in cell wall biosynthesis
VPVDGHQQVAARDADRLVERRGPVAPRVVDQPDRRCVVAGRELGDDVAARMRSLVAAGRLQLGGPLEFGPALFQQYADADVFVLPSRSEATPRVLVEARAFGCPVVATAVGGVPTSVDDGVDGLLVAPEDAAALAAALERVRADDALRAALVAAGRDRARRHTVEAFTAVLADEIDALVQLVGAATRSAPS